MKETKEAPPPATIIYNLWTGEQNYKSLHVIYLYLSDHQLLQLLVLRLKKQQQDFRSYPKTQNIMSSYGLRSWSLRVNTCEDEGELGYRNESNHVDSVTVRDKITVILRWG